MKDVVLATLAIGFGDVYRKNYSMPTGFQLENTSGFAPIYGALEYGLSKHVGIEAVLCYDAFYANISRLYTGTGGLYKRHYTDHVKLFSAGVAAYYHLGDLVPVKKLDVFGGLGIALNNARHSNLPQGDSLATVTDHFVSPQLRVGARYYITQRASVFLNAGFDRKSTVNFGFSCRCTHY